MNTSFSKVSLALILLASLSVLALYWIVSNSPIDKKLIWNETFKSLLQVIVVLIVGSFTSVLIGQYNDYKKYEEIARDFRKSSLLRLHKVYADTKRVRRLLRAIAFSPSYYDGFNKNALVKTDKYDEQMLVLNDIQLELELLKKEIEITHRSFKNLGSIHHSVGDMENYLKHIIIEWQEKRGNIADQTITPIIALPVLAAFLSAAAEGGFEKKFIYSYSEAVRDIKFDIVKY